MITDIPAWFREQVAAPFPSLWQVAREEYFNPGGGVPFTIEQSTSISYVWSAAVENEATQLRERASMALGSYIIASERDPNVVPFRWLPLRDKIRANAFATIYELNVAILTDPAMVAYLTAIGNRKYDPDDPAFPNPPDENLSREDMQLFMIGILILSALGYPVLDENGDLQQNYIAQDVAEFARVLTGIRLQDLPEVFDRNAAYDYGYDDNGDFVLYGADYELPVKFVPGEHDFGRKAFLGGVIEAKSGPYTPADVLDDIEQAARIITDHASCHPFHAFNIIQHVAQSNPDPQVVELAVAALDKGQFRMADGIVEGTGKRGCMKALWACLVSCPSLWNTSDPDRTKVMDTDALVMAVSRFLLANPADRPRMITNSRLTTWNDTTNYLAKMGGAWSHEPSVFGRKPPRNQKPGSPVTQAGLYFPEGAIWNESTMLAFINTVREIMADEARVRRARIAGGSDDRFFDCEPGSLAAHFANDHAQLAEEISVKFAGGRLEADTKAAIVSYLDHTATYGTDENHAAESVIGALGIAATSAEYLVRGVV